MCPHYREFNVEKGREMLSSSLVWRKKHGVDKILSEYQVSGDSKFVCWFLQSQHGKARWPIADSGSAVSQWLEPALAGAPDYRHTGRAHHPPRIGPLHPKLLLQGDPRYWTHKFFA